MFQFVIHLGKILFILEKNALPYVRPVFFRHLQLFFSGAKEQKTTIKTIKIGQTTQTNWFSA
jgi:hypothetical protein